jgi:hypothetical protein
MGLGTGRCSEVSVYLESLPVRYVNFDTSLNAADFKDMHREGMSCRVWTKVSR